MPKKEKGKMSVFSCPSCKAKIREADDIQYVQRGDMYYTLNLIDENTIDYEENEFQNNDVGVFFCRVCGVELGLNETQVIKILRKAEKKAED